jgi:hypothetical protein
MCIRDRHATQVNTATYPDDGSSPVGSNEWNEAPDQAGMIGNTPTTSTITIATGVATVTDSVTVVAAETGTTDTLDKLSITNTNEFDLVYLFADTGDTITLTHTSSPSADGHISAVSDADETLSSTTPTILIRKGNYWYGYGGGVVNAVSDIGDVTITSNSSGEILKWNGSAWVNNTLAEADIGTATAVALNTAKTGITSGQASAITANTSKVTNATHTGDVTGATALSIASGVVTNTHLAGSIAQSKITNLTSDLALKSPLASPTFTGTVAIPNYADVESTLDGIATNATAVALKSPLASPTFTGTVTTAAVDVAGNNIDNIQNLIHDTSATTTALDFSGDQLQTISISANTTFTTSNRAIGKSKTIKITTDATLRTLTFPAWKFVGAKPADQAASKIGILTITSFGTADTDIVAAYAVEA